MACAVGEGACGGKSSGETVQCRRGSTGQMTWCGGGRSHGENMWCGEGRVLERLW